MLVGDASWKGAITGAGEDKLLASSATKDGRRSLRGAVRKMLDHLDQSSITSPDTRANSFVLLVTTGTRNRKAWAAIIVSNGPIGRPLRSNSDLTFP